MKKVLNLVNGIMGAFIGAFVGRVCFVVWDYKTDPGFYGMQSAPWYTTLLVEGAITLAILLVCVVIKVIIKQYMSKKN